MNSPLELLTNSGNREKPFLTDKWNPLVCGAFGFGMACFINWATRKPVFSGIQQHIILGGGGFGAGAWIDKNRDEYLAERDATLRHYVQLHPDDFPPQERKKWADVIIPWNPIR